MARGKVNINKMREKHEEISLGGGDFWNPEPGETIVYVHPPCREDDEYEPTEGLPYVPIEVHYKVGGPNGPMMVSLDVEANPILEHPFVKKVLKKRKIKITGGECPIQEWVDNEADDTEAERAKRGTKYLWGVTPLRYKAPKSKTWTDLPPKPSILMAGIMIHDGIMEQFDELEDITDYDGAILLRIKKRGKGMKTKYTVDPDTKTLRKPLKLDASFIKMLEEAMKPEGDCDLFRVAGNLVKGTEEVEAAISGVELDDDDDDDDDDETPRRSKKSTKRRKKPEPEDDDEEDDEPEDEPEDADEEDDADEAEDDEAEDDEEDGDSDDDEDDDEEDDDDALDELDRELAELSKKRSKKKAAKKKAAKKRTRK